MRVSMVLYSTVPGTGAGRQGQWGIRDVLLFVRRTEKLPTERHLEHFDFAGETRNSRGA